MNTPDPHPVLPWLTPERRAWIYIVAAATVPLLAFYGLVADAAIPLWIAFGGAFLSTGTAALHTPTRTTHHDEGHSLVVVALVAAVVCLLILLALDLVSIG